MAPHVDYYFSPISPWTYLAGERFQAMARKAGATVGVWPVDFNRIFAASGGLPLGQRAPQRRAYRMQELARWRRRLGVPLTLEPKHFPTNAKPACLMIIAAREAGEDALGLSQAILTACWVGEKDIALPATLEAAAAGLGLDGAALLAASAKPEIEALYDRDTQAAIDRGVFGAPSFIVEEELFWGQDRLDFVAEKLGVA